MRPPQTWKELFTAALLELDDDKLPLRIEAARAAITERLEQWRNGNQGDESERMALRNSLGSLRSLEKSLEKRSQ